MLKILFLVSLALLAASHIQSVKSSSSGGSDAGVQKPCARLFHPETGEQLELPSLPEKKKKLLGGAAAGSEGAFSFSSFTVMDGCLLSLWVAGSQEWGLESRSFPSGAYLNQLPGAGVSLTSYQCTCDQENKVMASFRDFKKRHIAGRNENGSGNFCTRKIRHRHIYLNGRCKYLNTFVFADDNDVINVCRNQGYPISNNLYKSRNQFRIVDCKNANQNRRPPNCTYTAQNANAWLYIVVACDNNMLPVHFEGSSNRPPVFGITGRL
ncbi:hypothetical protein AOXY_G31595 [Acipenser oxyrinchus oxyrinchus]|uniref:Ribonuclease A-domain domain-containing protein n=1 Tax=Acipenser oxyrinchus oxyrinchus TaxID=40147 RepID=A0AAD8FU31_ACIOX|nr:hypothetical protein AOXY_G31595 [Acipenser oxyrinchus oxyrinchus]